MIVVVELKIPENIRGENISESDYILKEFEDLQESFAKINFITECANDPTTELGLSDLLQIGHGGDSYTLSEREIKNACDLIHAYTLSRNGYLKPEDVMAFKNESISFKQLLTRKNK